MTTPEATNSSNAAIKTTLLDPKMGSVIAISVALIARRLFSKARKTRWLSFRS